SFNWCGGTRDLSLRPPEAWIDLPMLEKLNTKFTLKLEGFPRQQKTTIILRRSALAQACWHAIWHSHAAIPQNARSSYLHDDTAHPLPQFLHISTKSPVYFK